MSAFLLTVATGIASLYPEGDAVNPPIAEGFGATNDEAVADLLTKVTFDDCE